MTRDRLGQTVKSEASEDGSTYTVATDSAYEQMGKITYTSNPHRAGTASTDGWTRITKDDIGRVLEIATFDGPPKPTASATNWNGHVQTSYNAEQTSVTDQAGKQRKSIVDGLGRLRKVFEDPGSANIETDYTYDALGNLLQVDQGSQHRFFTYDSLSRLKTATNPEQLGVASNYDYDEASNLLTRTNPNQTTVGFTYDGLNRVKGKTPEQRRDVGLHLRLDRDTQR